MILEKIQKFRNSPNRTVLTVSKSDTFGFSKKSELNSGGKNAKICFCNAQSQENGISNSEQNDAAQGTNGSESENGVQSNTQEAQNAQNGPISARNDNLNTQNTNTPKKASCGSKNGSSNCQSGTNNAISGNVSMSFSCNVLLCDVIAGISSLCLLGKVIREIKRMF